MTCKHEYFSLNKKKKKKTRFIMHHSITVNILKEIKIFLKSGQFKTTFLAQVGTVVNVLLKRFLFLFSKPECPSLQIVHKPAVANNRAWPSQCQVNGTLVMNCKSALGHPAGQTRYSSFRVKYEEKMK